MRQDDEGGGRSLRGRLGRGGISAGVARSLSAVSAASLESRARERVIGQDEALGELARYVAMRCSCMRAYARGVGADDLPRTQACFLIGPTASGKTFMARTMLGLVCKKVLTIDCTPLTGSGWKGANVQDQFDAIKDALGRNTGEVIGVIWDEADKLAKPEREGYDAERSFNPSLDMLPYLDGSLEGLDAQRVINVMCGAFDGIEKYVERRAGRSGVGFSSIPGRQADEDLRA